MLAAFIVLKCLLHIGHKFKRLLACIQFAEDDFHFTWRKVIIHHSLQLLEVQQLHRNLHLLILIESLVFSPRAQSEVKYC